MVEDLPAGVGLLELARLAAHELADGFVAHVVVRAERDDDAHVLRAIAERFVDVLRDLVDGGVTGAVGHDEGDTLAVEIMVLELCENELADLIVGEHGVGAADARRVIDAGIQLGHENPFVLTKPSSVTGLCSASSSVTNVLPWPELKMEWGFGWSTNRNPIPSLLLTVR